jgi:hypothetical protein
VEYAQQPSKKPCTILVRIKSKALHNQEFSPRCTKMSNSSAVDIDHHDIEVDALIKQWAFANTEKIVKHYAQKGGWEGWAQCEIAAVLTDHFRAIQGSTKSVVEREVPVYPAVGNSRQRADVVVQMQSNGKLVQAVIIELKCEGYHNADAFVTNVEADVKKVGGIVKDEYKPAWMWVMGFSASEPTYKKMKSKYPNGTSYEVYPVAAGQNVQLHPDEIALNPKIVLWIFEHEKRLPGDGGSASQPQSQSSNPVNPTFGQVATGVGVHMVAQTFGVHTGK